jgi:hypothetical protein
MSTIQRHFLHEKHVELAVVAFGLVFFAAAAAAADDDDGVAAVTAAATTADGDRDVDGVVDWHQPALI